MKLPLSQESACIDQKGMAALVRLPKFYGHVIGHGLREFSLAGLKGQDGEFWADRVTGQLYSPEDGHCLSNRTMWLELGSLKESRLKVAA
jgi:hypothetical protein